jgi:tetratricopeptide (TPR) repeat protein
LADDAVPVDEVRTEHARELFERGLERSKQERWAEALEFFNRSREIVERPVTVFNIATVLFRIGRAREALQSLDRFREIADPKEDAEQIALAADLRKTVLSTISLMTLTVEPADAQVYVDGELREGEGTERTLALDPGSHLVAVRSEGHVGHLDRIAVVAGETPEREVVLQPLEARLMIETNEPAAAIHIDGAHLGQGETALDLAPGSHSVRVEWRGEVHEREVKLEAGEQLRFDANFAEPLAKRPVFWVLFTGAVLAAGAAAVGLTFALREDEPYGGTVGRSFEGLRFAGPFAP